MSENRETSDNDVKLVLCPGCGAPLDFEEGQTTIHCKYCNDSFTNPAQTSFGNLNSAQNKTSREFIESIKRGDKANAIQLYMQMTHSSMPQANKVVERLLTHFKTSAPEQEKSLENAQRNRKILIVVILAAILVPIFIWIILLINNI
jgi:LSD1 subclass zinc finger protein